MPGGCRLRPRGLFVAMFVVRLKKKAPLSRTCGRIEYAIPMLVNYLFPCGVLPCAVGGRVVDDIQTQNVTQLWTFLVERSGESASLW